MKSCSFTLLVKHFQEVFFSLENRLVLILKSVMQNILIKVSSFFKMRMFLIQFIFSLYISHPVLKGEISVYLLLFYILPYFSEFLLFFHETSISAPQNPLIFVFIKTSTV